MSTNVTFFGGLLDFGTSVITTTLEESKPTLVSGAKDALSNAFGLTVQPDVTTGQGPTSQIMQVVSNTNPLILASAAAVAAIGLVVILKKA